MASREAELQELADLEELERLEAEEAASVKKPEEDNGPIEMRVFRHRTGAMMKEPAHPLEVLRAGIGSGMVRAGRGLTNLAVKAGNNLTPEGLASKIAGTPGPYEMPDFANDEALKEQDRLDAPLSQTTEGGLGQMVGSTAATLPLGLGPGRALSPLENAGRLTRTLAAPSTRSALEGAISGAAMADPDKQTGTALMAGAAGKTMSKMGQALKRTVGGLAKTGEAADHLEQFAEQHRKDIFIPLAQAVDDNADLPSRLLKSAYREAVPLVPGASGKIAAQTERLGNDVREIALREADFKGILGPDDYANPDLAARKLKGALDKEYADTIHKYAFRVPNDFHGQVQRRVAKAIPNIDDVTNARVATLMDENLARYSSNGTAIDGQNLLAAKRSVEASMKKLKGRELEAAKAAVGEFDEIIERRMNAGRNVKAKEDYARYRGLEEPEKALDAVTRATGKAKVDQGRFTPSQLVRSSDSDVQTHLGQTAEDILSRSPQKSTMFGRLATLGALGTLGAVGSPGASAGLLAGGNLAATEGAQRMLMGKTGPQLAMIELLRSNPKTFNMLGSAGRNAVTTEMGAEDGYPR